MCSWQSELASLCLRGRAASVGVDRPSHPTVWRIHLMQKSFWFFFVLPPLLFLHHAFLLIAYLHTRLIVWYKPRWKSSFGMNLLSAVLLEPLHRLQGTLGWLSFCWQWATSRLLTRMHCYALSCINTTTVCWSNNVLIFTLMKPLCCNLYGILPI